MLPHNEFTLALHCKAIDNCTDRAELITIAIELGRFVAVRASCSELVSHSEVLAAVLAADASYITDMWEVLSLQTSNTESLQAKCKLLAEAALCSQQMLTAKFTSQV